MATSGVPLRTVAGDSFLKRVVTQTDWTLVLVTFALTAFGTVMIISATLSGGQSSQYMAKQAVAILLGLIAGTVFGLLNYQIFQRYWLVLFVAGIALLLFVLGFGTAFRATKAWIHLGVLSFQPSEAVKILFILALAGYLDQTSSWPDQFKRACTASCMAGVMVLLLLAQPDLSAAILYLPITFVLLHVGGVERRFLVVLLVFTVLTAVLMLARMYVVLSDPAALGGFGRWMHGALRGQLLQVSGTVAAVGVMMGLWWWFARNLRIRVSPVIVPAGVIIVTAALGIVAFGGRHIKTYQQKRLIAFINPHLDPSDAGYQIIQTRIAIGSGGLWGKGLFQGTQTQLGFVPEKHTDFIFSLIAEETGLFGALLTIFLYVLILARGLAIMRTAGETYGILVAAGIVAMFAFYFIINVGMNLGVTPVVGLPLPFVSYGGSNLISSYAAVGVLNSIHLRKYLN